MGDLYDSLTGKTAADASIKGANISAEAQREALEYLKSQEALPTEYRNQALNQLAGIYGLTPASYGTPQIDTAAIADLQGQMDALGTGSGVSSGTGAISGMAQNMMQKIDLQQQIDALQDPQQQIFGGAAGVSGGAAAQGMTQQGMIDQAQQSALYSSIMGGQQAGEEAIMRQASATGGLRSGNIQENLYDYSTQLSNQALLESYNQQMSGLQGMAGLPSNANTIAQQMGNIGQTQAQGVIGAGQAQQQGMSNLVNTGLGIGGMVAMFSDARLKEDVKKIGTKNGFNLYSWVWNEAAEKFGLHGKDQGFMAHEVAMARPDAISKSNGFLTVIYAALEGGFVLEGDHV